MSEHADLFSKAALVARDPQRFEMLSELNESEKNALSYERDHKWHGPKMLWYAISLCAIGAATQGVSKVSSLTSRVPLRSHYANVLSFSCDSGIKQAQTEQIYHGQWNSDWRTPKV